jgi:methylated-DNA-[protein]-cysteine S-methyltransferase
MYNLYKPGFQTGTICTKRPDFRNSGLLDLIPGTRSAVAMNRSLNTPAGRLTMWETNGQITRLDWDGNGIDRSEVLDAGAAQLAAYFAGDLTEFSLPLKLGNTPFQARFLQALIDIPYGETKTYGELAKQLGVSAQAIGQACGANPIPVIVPCHRVLASNGLGGFSGAGGVEAKVLLLKHEGAASLLI